MKQDDEDFFTPQEFIEMTTQPLRIEVVPDGLITEEQAAELLAPTTATTVFNEVGAKDTEHPQKSEILKVKCLHCGNAIHTTQFNRLYSDHVEVLSHCCGHSEFRAFLRREIKEINETGGWTAFLSGNIPPQKMGA